MEKESIVPAIKARISISSVVGQAVELKGRSPNFLGLCPFHQEKTPSFHVRDQVGRFKCFGCGASGDAFEFLMRLRGISFAEAMTELAKKAGLLEDTRRAHPEKAAKEKDVLSAQKVAQEYFVSQLAKSPHALAYLLEQRGLGQKMIRQAGIGFGGASKEDFQQFLHAKGISDERAIEAGLLKQGRFSLIPPFLSRITFPIRDNDGVVVGFGGRAFLEHDKDVPKYVNTHSYSHYEKRKTFYGWYESKSAMQKGAVPVLVEGYFDAMAMWASGMPALALCGTALTSEHVAQLRLMSSRLIICFDADNAGITALRSALVLVQRANIEPRLAILDEKDPGDYLVKRKLEGLKAHLNAPVDAICYLIEQAALSAQESVSERVRQIDLLLPIFASIKRPLVRRQYVAHLAKRLHEEPALLWSEIENKVKAEPKAKAAASRKFTEAKRLSPEERLALEIALSHPVLIGSMSTVLAHFSASIKQLLETFGQAWQARPHERVEELMKIAAHSVDAELWPGIADIVEYRIILSHDEATTSLTALERKIGLQSIKASIKEKRRELEGFARKKDFVSVLSSLKEKSELWWSHKATNESVAEEKRVQAVAKAKEVKVTPTTNDVKIRHLGETETFFDANEDW